MLAFPFCHLCRWRTSFPSATFEKLLAFLTVNPQSSDLFGWPLTRIPTSFARVCPVVGIQTVTGHRLCRLTCIIARSIRGLHDATQCIRENGQSGDGGFPWTSGRIRRAHCESGCNGSRVHPAATHPISRPIQQHPSVGAIEEAGAIETRAAGAIKAAESSVMLRHPFSLVCLCLKLRYRSTVVHSSIMGWTLLCSEQMQDTLMLPQLYQCLHSDSAYPCLVMQSFDEVA